MTKNIRSSNYELMRIIAMFLIVMYHIYLHSFQGQFLNSALSPNKIIAASLGAWGILGVDLFVLISAFFLIDSKFKTARILRLYICVVFYYFIFGIFAEGVSIKLFVRALLIPFLNEYWFVQAFILMLLFTPFMNKFINKNPTSVLFKLICLLFVTVSIYHTVYTSASIGKWAVFVLLYFWGGVIKRSNYIVRLLSNSSVVAIVVLAIYSIVLLATIMISYNNSYIPIYKSLIGKYSPLMIVLAAIIFVRLSQTHMHSAIINQLGSCVLGVYIISEHPFLHNYVYQEWNILCINHSCAHFFVLFIIYSVVIFVTTSLIEYIRVILFKPIHKAIEDSRFVKKINCYINAI